MAKPKAILHSLDEIDPEATVRLGDCYVQATSEQAERFNGGKPFWLFDLQRADGWSNANVDRLNKALERTRKAEQTLARFGDLTPDQARETVEQLETLRAELDEAKKRGKTAADWEKQKADLVAAHQAELAKASEAQKRLRAELHETVTVAGARKALAAAGFAKNVELMLPHVLPFLEYVPGENGAAGRTRVMREDRSTERLDPSTGAPLNETQFAKELAGDKRYEILLDGDGASGGGLTGGGAPGEPSRKEEKAPLRRKSGAVLTAKDIDSIAAHGLVIEET